MFIDCKTMRQVVMGDPDITNRYLKEIRVLKPLGYKEQTELIREYANCNDKKRKQEIKNTLVTSNQHFIISMARHLSSGDDFNDLISEGNLGLIKAIDAFDVEKENRFLTYAAHWIRKAMTDYIVFQKRIIKPKNTVRVYAYSDSAKSKFFCENGRFPTEEELVSILSDDGINFSNKEDLYNITVSSIDAGFDEENLDTTDANWFDKFCYTKTCGGDEANNIHEHIDDITTKQTVNKSLSYLTDNEREILCKYFGIGGRQYTVFELAHRLGTTENNVEKLIRKYIKKIRKNGKVEINVH